MQRFYLILTGAVFLAGGAFLFSEESETELDRVTRQVESLRTEVSHLAAQLERLREEFRHFRAQGNPPPPGIPPGATEGEINGIKYYLVPVTEPPESP